MKLNNLMIACFCAIVGAVNLIDDFKNTFNYQITSMLNLNVI